eukprot:scaffold287_cov337-Pavlova_lutheri.AAC.28
MYDSITSSTIFTGRLLQATFSLARLDLRCPTWTQLTRGQKVAHVSGPASARACTRLSKWSRVRPVSSSLSLQFRFVVGVRARRLRKQTLLRSLETPGWSLRVRTPRPLRATSRKSWPASRGGFERFTRVGRWRAFLADARGRQRTRECFSLHLAKEYANAHLSNGTKTFVSKACKCVNNVRVCQCIPLTTQEPWALLTY